MTVEKYFSFWMIIRTHARNVEALQVARDCGIMMLFFAGHAVQWLEAMAEKWLCLGLFVPATQNLLKSDYRQILGKAAPKQKWKWFPLVHL
jgi:hypothetical protein